MAKNKEVKDLDKKADKDKASKSSKQKPAKSSPGILGKFGGYLKGVVQELKRVTWPTPKEMLNSGVIVIVTLIFFALFTFAFDQGAVKAVTALADTTASKETTTSPSNNATVTATPSTSATSTATGTSK
ncbi:MAG: preprotein translocase subunit SecE [Coriobacteriia bacterium]|nr:preprotein translocase subunit SecE [Coriobacteriia bacterium]